jgi:hypothetical protein
MHSERPLRLGRVKRSTFAGILVCALLIAALPEDSLAARATDPRQTDGMARGLAQKVATMGPMAEVDHRRQLRGSRRKRARTRPLAAARSVARQTTPAATVVAVEAAVPAKSVPDGFLVSWRKHANGNVAAVVGHYDGGLTARPWPQRAPFVTGLSSLAEAQARADEIAHADCAGTCGPWRPA